DYGSVEPAAATFTRANDEAAALLEQAMEDSRQGDKSAALAKRQRALEIYRKLGNTSGEILALNDVGEHYYATGNFDNAERYYKEALALAGRTEQRASSALIQDNLGLLYANQLRQEEAEAAYRQSLGLFEELQDKAGMSAVLGNLGLLLLN